MRVQSENECPGSTQFSPGQDGMMCDGSRTDQDSGLVNDLNERQVLIAEDNADIARLLEIFLSSAGYQVQVVSQGNFAVDAALSWKPDLIVMDLLLPEMDGYDAVKILRSKGFVNPILALTANARADDKIKCLSIGFDDYMGKPVEREFLLKKVADLLHN